MSFLFDLTASQASLNVKFHGGGEYCKKIFYKLCQTEFNFKCVYNSLKYIDTDIIKKCKEKGITLFDLKEQSLEDIVKKQNIKFIYSALPEGILPWPNCTILGTIHGLRALEMKFDFKSHYLFDNGIIGLNSFLGLLKRKKNLKKHFNIIKNY